MSTCPSPIRWLDKTFSTSGPDVFKLRGLCPWRYKTTQHIYLKRHASIVRRDDIPMLAHSFLQKLNSVNKTRKYLAPEVIARLTTYNFPGNVRKLQNAMERAFFSARGTAINDVPLEAQGAHDSSAAEDAQSWFKDLSEGRKDFWSAVHKKYKRRDISREKVMALIDFGLRSTRGDYKTMATKFRLKEKDYRRFMDFLRRGDCLLDFRPYRKLATTSES